MKKSHKLTMFSLTQREVGALWLRKATFTKAQHCQKWFLLWQHLCMDSSESFKSWTPPWSLLTECTNHISHPSFPPFSTQPQGHKLQHLGWHFQQAQKLLEVVFTNKSLFFQALELVILHYWSVPRCGAALALSWLKMKEMKNGL